MISECEVPNFDIREIIISSEVSNLPSAMARIQVSDDSYKDHFLLKSLPLENPQGDVLHERVNTNDYIRLVFH